METESGVDDGEFFRKYEAFDLDSAVEFLTRYCKTEIELQPSVDFLVKHRELVRDAEPPPPPDQQVVHAAMFRGGTRR